MRQLLREITMCGLSAALTATAVAMRHEQDDHIVVRSVAITDSEGKTRITLNTDSDGAFVRLLDAAGNERLVLGCSASQHMDEEDDSTVKVQLNRKDGGKSIAVVHQDEHHHGDQQSISFSYGGSSDVDRLRLSSLWFGLEDGSELLMNNRDGRPVVHATTGAMANRPLVALRTFDLEGPNEKPADVARWLQLGQAVGLDEHPNALGVFAGQGSARTELGVGGEAAAFVSAQDDRGSASLVPGR